MKHPYLGLGDSITDLLVKEVKDKIAAESAVPKVSILPAGWCHCGNGLCRCNIPLLGLEGDWCRAGVPGGLTALKAALTSQVATPAPLPVPDVATGLPAPIPAPPALAVRPPWYLGYVLWKRGMWPKRRTAP
jgi:hypothetical protein